MNSFILRIHEEIRAALRTRRGATHHPKDVLRFSHKRYPRMPQHPLPAPAPLAMTLDAALAARHSSDHGDASTSYTRAEMGSLLGHALGARGDKHRNYPSGGALYPVETYVITDRFDDAVPSVFHYDPTAHALEELFPLPADFDLKDLIPHAEPPLSALIVFTAVWERSSAKYGDLAYSHGMLEAGHMSENVLLVAAALNLEARPIAGFDDALITKLLDLGFGEQPVHTILLSKSASRS